MARAMAICVAKILTMLDRQEEAAVYFQRAKDLGSNEARLIQWLSKHEAFLNSEEVGSLWSSSFCFRACFLVSMSMTNLGAVSYHMGVGVPVVCQY